MGSAFGEIIDKVVNSPQETKKRVQASTPESSESAQEESDAKKLKIGVSRSRSR